MQKTEFSSLDVGCGIRNRAEIRLDIKKSSRNKANILGSAHNLPFKNKVFKTVFCYHVLEHLADPKKALRELYRVGEHIKIKLPVLFYHHKRKFDFRCLGLKWRYGLDRERKRFGVPFRVEISSNSQTGSNQYEECHPKQKGSK